MILTFLLWWIMGVLAFIVSIFVLTVICYKLNIVQDYTNYVRGLLGSINNGSGPANTFKRSILYTMIAIAIIEPMLYTIINTISAIIIITKIYKDKRS